jgi:hypothetical protein
MDTTNNRLEPEMADKNGYLWDGSGEPDPEIQRLERLLAEFRHNRPAPVFPQIVPDQRWTLLPRPTRLVPVLALAAAVATIVLTLLVFEKNHAPVGAIGWDVSSVSGTPRIGPQVIRDRAAGRLRVGQVLETDAQSRASLQDDDVGHIDVDPGTRLRLLNLGADFKWMALDHGTIHAQIWAPPGQFVVDTPSAITVDLGCAYTLQVDASGAGLIRTSIGWVGFKLNGRESFIPAGAACATTPKVGPGTPYFEDASSEFRDALSRFDFEDAAPSQRDRDLAIVLAESRKQDALTLWHLLARVDDAHRMLVYNRLSALAPPPANVTREGILRLDPGMLDTWWNSLGFDDISVWRHWERSWSGVFAPAEQK